jgi:hypothetical protein
VIQLTLQVEDHGSLWLLRPITEAGRDWLHEHTGDEAQWFGSALVVEPRYVADIVQGMQEEGLAVA